MNILAIETATEACSVALLANGDQHELYELAPRRHAHLVLEMADSMLAKAGLAPSDLDRVAFGRGPGSFTGLRIAAAVTQGIAYGAGAEIVPVSSLRALALEAILETGAERVFTAIDARMDQVYHAVWKSEDARIEIEQPEQVSFPGIVDVDDLACPVVIGSGCDRWGSEMNFPGKVVHLTDRFPRAGAILALALAEDATAGRPENAVPVYIRDKVTG